MKKAIFFLLDQYADWEASYLASRLNNSVEWEVKTASLKAEVCISMGGFRTLVDYGLDEIPVDIDLFVLIGGNGWNIESDKLSHLITRLLKKECVVAAICGAVDYMAKYGHLNEYKHTGNALYLWSGYECYQNQVNFLSKQVVVDKNLITANGTAAVEFSELILKVLKFGPELQIEKEHRLFSIGYCDYVEKFGNPFI